MREDVRICAEILNAKIPFRPLAAVVLGSGLGGFGETLESPCIVPYSELPGFPVSTVPGHEGRFLIGYAGGIPVICMQGRVHLYEGYTPQQAVMPLRVMHAVGARYLIVTNAAGGINPSYHIGDLALLTDHISLFAPNPLIGPNDEEEGIRFPDMSCVYDPRLREIAHEVASEKGIALQEGVYAQLTGPSFETPAEIRMMQRLGADLVGMSTVVEVIAARHAGMRTVGISLVSNLASGISEVPLSDDDVKLAGKAAAPRFTDLVTGILRGIGNEEQIL